MKSAVIVATLGALALFSVSSAFATENYTPYQSSSATSSHMNYFKKLHFVQGCANGQTWCCQKTASGGSACKCQSFCF
jgi:hypothetical protein